MFCRLCTSLEKSSELREEWNRPIAESRNFIALPSLGSLVPGWTLIVPKQHFMCFSALPDALLEEVKYFKKEIQDVLVPHFGSTVVFEHGSPRPAARIGCGVDHAHLHIVPFQNDLKLLTREVSKNNLNWEKLSDPSDVAGHKYSEAPYFYLEDSNGIPQIAVPNHDESQLFRKAIAFSLGCLDAFDWKLDPCIDQIRATVNVFDKITDAVEHIDT